MPLGTEVDLGPGDTVLDGDTPPPKKKEAAQHPQFWPMYCGQTVAWIKIPLRMMVGLGPCHIVLHREPTLPKKGHSVPQF